MVSDYFKLFCKKKEKKRNLIEELGTPVGEEGRLLGGAGDFKWPRSQRLIGEVVSERLKRITEVCKWDQAVLWPEGNLFFRSTPATIALESSHSLLIRRPKPEPGTLMHYRQPDSDDLYRPTAAHASTLPSSKEQVNFSGLIKAAVQNEKPREKFKKPPFFFFSRKKGHWTAAQNSRATRLRLVSNCTMKYSRLAKGVLTPEPQ